MTAGDCHHIHELVFVDLPTAVACRDIIEVYLRHGFKCGVDEALMQVLVELSEGIAGSAPDSAVREVVE